LAENAFRWLDDEVNFTKRAAMREAVNLIGSPEGRRNPEEVIAKMIETIPARDGKFRNVIPQAVEDKIKGHQAKMFELEI
jgi:hypothetical protein